MSLRPFLVAAALGSILGCAGDLVLLDDPKSPYYGGPVSATTIHAYGDSITCGVGLPDASCLPGDAATVPSLDAYPEVIASDRGMTVQNHAIPGDQACDLWTRQIGVAGDPAPAPGETIYTVQIGTNDALGRGPGDHETLFNLCDQAAMAWLALPTGLKLLADDPSLATTGAVSYRADITGSMGELTTDERDATISVPLTLRSAGTVYLFYALVDGNDGTWTYSIGGFTGSGKTAEDHPLLTNNGTVASMALLRLPDVPAGPQILRITQTSSGSEGFALWGVGVLPPPPVAGLPTVAVGIIPLIHGSKTRLHVIDVYNGDLRASVALLQKDGLDVRFIDSHSLMKATPAEMLDAIHPNALGQRELATAFEQQF